MNKVNSYLLSKKTVIKLSLLFTLLILSIPVYKVNASSMIPDYKKNDDGIWVNTLQENDSKASPLNNLISNKYLSPTKILSRKNTSSLLMFTGDLMCLAGQQFAAETKGKYDFYPSYKLVAPLFNSADFVCGNLESLISESNPITKIQKNIGTAPQCNGPESYLQALRQAGIDCVATANNHCCDWGTSGIIETEEMLDKYGFAHVGTSKNIDENFVLFDVKGIKVAVLSYTHLINQREKMTLDEMSSMVSEFSKSRAEKDISEAKEKGAEFIVVYCHWGSENTEELREYQKSDAKAIAEMGANLIIGSHPHCLQGKEIIETSDGRHVPCMYSMGNFVSSMVRDINNDTLILTVRINRNSDGNIYIQNIDYIPCRVLSVSGYSSFTVVPTQTKYNFKITSSILPAAEARIRKIIGSF